MTTIAASLPGSHYGHCSSCGFGGYTHAGPRLMKRTRSAEFEDLPLLSIGQKSSWPWLPPPFLKEAIQVKKAKRQTYAPGRSPLERLPPELLDIVLENVRRDRVGDLIPCLLTSRSLRLSSLAILYKKVRFFSSLPFSQFLAQLERYPDLRSLVERLDFSQFTPVGLGRSQKASSQVQMLTADTMTRCLELTPRVREFLAQQHLDADMDDRVLRQLLCLAPRLEALDLCAASSSVLLNGIIKVIRNDNPELPEFLPIQRLGLHECINLPTQVFKILLPRLTHLTRLDVAHTTIDHSALTSVPRSARLTHLNISRCARLSGAEIADFLLNHPAARSLVHLNISAEPSSRSGISIVGLEQLLPRLPATLKSLNLGGNAVERIHLPHLVRLTKHLEELGLGHTKLKLPELNALFVPAKADPESMTTPAIKQWAPCTLRFLDISGLPTLTSNQLCGSQTMLLSAQKNASLEVIEVDDSVAKSLKRRQTEGWMTQEIGRRNFLVRLEAQWKPSEKRSLVERKARRWGDRKMAMSDAKVGGIYSHYSSGVK